MRATQGLRNPLCGGQGPQHATLSSPVGLSRESVRKKAARAYQSRETSSLRMKRDCLHNVSSNRRLRPESPRRGTEAMARDTARQAQQVLNAPFLSLPLPGATKTAQSLLWAELLLQNDPCTRPILPPPPEVIAWPPSSPRDKSLCRPHSYGELRVSGARETSQRPTCSHPALCEALFQTPLGQGGSATVWQTQTPQGGCALKLASKPANNESLLREARVLARLSKVKGVLHCHARVFLRENEDVLLGLLLPLMPDGDLHSWLQRSSCSAAEIARVGSALARTLGIVHGLGIVHADVKPENVLISTRSNVLETAKLADFGTAFDALHDGPGPARRGTPGFAAPELVRHGRISAACDVFGLGVTLAIMAFGQHPFAGVNIVQMLRKVCLHQPVLKGRRWPQSVREALVLVLDKEPRRRPVAAQIPRLLRFCLHENPSFESLSPSACRLVNNLASLGPFLGADALCSHVIERNAWATSLAQLCTAASAAAPELPALLVERLHVFLHPLGPDAPGGVATPRGKDAVFRGNDAVANALSATTARGDDSDILSGDVPSTRLSFWRGRARVRLRPVTTRFQR